ncbi:DUF2071 domain-containing protein [Oceanobacillus piezotolerans]|uniref:DUF2071 domain-containing protein n=1 Tax=Oceanobacillus piezotolerans TaxID=2448030 RepID=A0A498DBU3_9BACI|nr:DUF2071 domain-containing protein [Oceanobacillus piezotolerans]
MLEKILNSTDHRDFPLPDGPWVMKQRWDHLLFMHLPISAAAIQPYIPKSLELDTYNRNAWITIIPFKVSNMRFRNLPPVPFLNSFLELNVRTYVKRDGKKGIYFFSLDANHLFAVLGARAATLPYYYAKINRTMRKNTICYSLERKGKSEAKFNVVYRPVSGSYCPKKAS